MAATLVEEFILLFQMACVIFLVTYLFAKSRFFTDVLANRATLATQVFLAIVFGLLSVYGMSTGISFYTANVNIRDFGPMAAGLACGPYVGLGAGLIGFAYRLFVGGTNVYAVAIGPLAAGIAGGLVWWYAGTRKPVRVRTAVMTTFAVESLVSAFAIAIRILDGEPASTWMTVTINVAVPMIIMTTLAVGLFSIILRNEQRERRLFDEKQHLEREVAARQNLSAIINTIAYPVYALDRDHRFTVVNESLCRFLGSTREEVLGKTPDDFFSAEDAAFHRAMTEDVFRSGTARQDEVTITKPDGGKCTLISTSSLFSDPSGLVFLVGVIQDITGRKKMEEDLAESEAWYRTLFEHTGTATIIIGEDGTIGQVNSGFAALTGYSRGEIAGTMKMKDFAHPDDLEMVKRYHRQRLLDPLSAPTFYTLRMKNRAGQVRILHAVVAVIPGTMKSIASYIDISDQKRTEDSLKLANRKLNLLSSITRHDIINQIMVLKGYLSLLRKRTDTPALLDFVGKSERAALNIENQIIFTRDYQDMGVKEPVWQKVENSITAAKGALPIGRIAVDADHAGVEVFADPLFEKVFFNLMDNSIRYGGDALQTIRIRVLDGTGTLNLIYEDDGAGIAAADHDHLFERGFGKHTGFGLFLSREILAITGITIEENGTEGNGARFVIRVPEGAYRFPPGSAEKIP